MTDAAQATNPTDAAPENEDTFDYGEANSEVADDTSTSDQTTDDQNTDVQAGDSQQTDPPVDDSEEIELEGQKLKIPKAVKPLLMFQADYTRKTQEVAEQRKAVEAKEAEIANQAKAQQEYIQDLAHLTAIDMGLKQFDSVNWQEWNQKDPVAAQAAWFQRTQLSEARTAIDGQIKQHEATRKQQEEQTALEKQQSTAKRREECYATVAREIKGWGPDLIKQLDTTAGEFGFSGQELSQWSDPRLIKLLHEAHVGRQLLKKQVTPPPPPPPKPVPQVGSGGAPARKSPDKMSMEEYAKWRRSQRK